MTQLEKFQKVNQTKTLQELSAVVEDLDDEDFDNKEIANECKFLDMFNVFNLPREYGIRQQGIYLIQLTKMNG